MKETAAGYGGLISISHFIRAFAELKASGAIRQMRQSDPLRAAFDEPEEELTRDAYYKIPAETIIRRYRGEPTFRAAVDKLISQGLIVVLLGVLPCTHWYQNVQS